MVDAAEARAGLGSESIPHTEDEGNERISAPLLRCSAFSWAPCPDAFGVVGEKLGLDSHQRPR